MQSTFLAVFLLAAMADGSLIEQKPCDIASASSYDEYVKRTKATIETEIATAQREGHKHTTPVVTLSKSDYEKRVKDDARIECRRLSYSSDGLAVTAYMWKLPGTEKRPLIIFNRGGSGDLAKLTPTTWVRRFVHDGFVVLASQYRGTESEGKDEYGGADVHDVLNLVPLAESLGVADMRNVFLLGWSRGGMESALAIKQGMKVNAAAMGGPLTDLVIEKQRRPEMVARNWAPRMIGYAEHTDEVLRERSAVTWPEAIRVPLLLMHGGADWRADPAATLAFAQALQRAGATYELVIYAGDDHGLSLNKEESNRRIVEWFRRYMVR